MAMASKKRGRAIVIGGSMAGLLAARTLADHFTEVELLERDRLGDDGEHRRGVPQSRHTHVLLASGCQTLELLFPGISRELVEAGASSGDVAQDVSWFVEGARLRRFSSNLGGLGISRALLERIVRDRIRSLPNTRVRDTTGVDELVTSRNHRRVVGVKSGADVFSADLVVDATGRGSRSPRWLEAIGYAAPRQQQVGMDLRYTTRLFRRQPHHLNGYDAVVITPPPSTKCGGVIVSQEGNRWTVTLMTHFGDFPPPEIEGFIDFARMLPAPDIYDVVRDAEPLGEAQTIRVPASVRHRYEHVRRFPRGYLVMGDAISSFNPIYGQGMSVAALQAVELGAVLRKGRRNLARRFFRRAAKVIDTAWSISAANDLRMPEASGRRNASVTFINWYVEKLLVAGHSDAKLARAFLGVSNLVAPPLSLMQPALLWRVARTQSRLRKDGLGRAFGDRNANELQAQSKR